MNKLLFAVVLGVSVLSQAAVLSYESGSKNLNGVNLSQSETVLDNGASTSIKLDILGAGLRTKTVLISLVKVYVAQLFSDNKPAFSRDNNALESLVKNSNFVGMKIDMLRTVTASALAASFKEALVANGYAIDSELSNLLALIENAAPATTGKSITILLRKDPSNDGKTNLYYEDTTGKLHSFTGSVELMGKIMSIWLGTPADDGLERLKADLLKPVY